MQVIPIPDSKIAEEINRLDELAKTHANQAIDYARQAGELLLKIRRNLPHGQWTVWVQANVKVSLRQAQRYLAIAEGKAVPVRGLTGKNDTVSLLDMPHPADFEPSWKPTKGRWHVALWNGGAYWVVPDLNTIGFHVSHFYVADRTVPESEWETLYDGTQGPVRADRVDWFLKYFGLPCAGEVKWKAYKRPGQARPFGEPASALQIQATS